MKKEFKSEQVSYARQEAAKAWCQENTKNTIMDPVLAEEFAKILLEHMYSPHLGCATTEELIDEVKTRIMMDGKLGYRTIDSERLANIQEASKKLEERIEAKKIEDANKKAFAQSDACLESIKKHSGA